MRIWDHRDPLKMQRRITGEAVERGKVHLEEICYGDVGSFFDALLKFGSAYNWWIVGVSAHDRANLLNSKWHTNPFNFPYKR